jgi:hypothetical protein
MTARAQKVTLMRQEWHSKVRKMQDQKSTPSAARGLCRVAVFVGYVVSSLKFPLGEVSTTVAIRRLSAAAIKPARKQTCPGAGVKSPVVTPSWSSHRSIKPKRWSGLVRSFSAPFPAHAQAGSKAFCRGEYHACVFERPSQLAGSGLMKPMPTSFEVTDRAPRHQGAL